MTSVKTLLSCTLAVAVWLVVPSASHAVTPDAQALLAASDAVRNPPKPFSVTVSLTEFRNRQQTDANTLEVYSRSDGASGQYRSLIRFVDPPRDANKLLLKSGNDL